MSCELMSPAGNLSSFIAAVDSGADSVYLGLDKFNARRPAQNFAPSIMRRVIQYAHSHNCKVYVTLNIQLKPNELGEACSMLQLLADIGADAVIVTDLAVIDMMKRFFPTLEPHFSTQTVIHNPLEVAFAAEQGAKRVVLARELTANEIESCVRTAKEHHIEVEIFTEGSMCFCVSGRCLMSSFIGGRSGNRGACTGCCRIQWTDENDNRGNLFSMKDLSLAEHLQEIANLGVSALKIEGRLKKSGWVAAITSAYRNILDGKSDTDISVLRKYTAREVGTGHVYGHNDIIGHNENWQDYIKTADDIDIPSKFADNVKIRIEINDTIVIQIDYRGQTQTLTENVPPLPKKAKTVSIALLENKINETLSAYDVTIVQDKS
ncbi:MAG: U32 family peptidase, partial [Spirochaetales bacterium]|nr:U32 family peptidase [Spirochaetales bacterium]